MKNVLFILVLGLFCIDAIFALEQTKREKKIVDDVSGSVENTIVSSENTASIPALKESKYCTIWVEQKALSSKAIAWADWGKGPKQIKDNDDKLYEVISVMEFVNILARNNWEVVSTIYNPTIKTMYFVMKNND